MSNWVEPVLPRVSPDMHAWSCRRRDVCPDCGYPWDFCVCTGHEDDYTPSDTREVGP